MRLSVAIASAALLVSTTALADENEPVTTRAKEHSFGVESFDVAITAFDQHGHGYQSKANSRSLLDPGDSSLKVFQPQMLMVVRQDEHIVHRLWVPIDFVTSASANAIDRGRAPDMITNSSRQNEAIALDWNVAYEAKKWETNLHNDIHIEENFRSWASGLGLNYSLADDAATISGSVNEVLDWFSGYDGLGIKTGRKNRSTSNGNVGFTQILTPYTVVHLNYGLSVQEGELSNTWNSVPFENGERFAERLPTNRWRHALVFRFAEWLPWNGALKGFYRFYDDNWGVVAHALEGQLLQRLHPYLYLRGSYRFYTQTAVDFFTTREPIPAEQHFTADSDLAKFDSQTLGLKATAELPFLWQGAHVDVGYEHYWRTDGLRVNIALWQAGARF